MIVSNNKNSSLVTIAIAMVLLDEIVNTHLMDYIDEVSDRIDAPSQISREIADKVGLLLAVTYLLSFTFVHSIGLDFTSEESCVLNIEADKKSKDKRKVAQQTALKKRFSDVKLIPFAKSSANSANLAKFNYRSSQRATLFLTYAAYRTNYAVRAIAISNQSSENIRSSMNDIFSNHKHALLADNNYHQIVTDASRNFVKLKQVLADPKTVGYEFNVLFTYSPEFNVLSLNAALYQTLMEQGYVLDNPLRADINYLAERDFLKQGREVVVNWEPNSLALTREPVMPLQLIFGNNTYNNVELSFKNMVIGNAKTCNRITNEFVYNIAFNALKHRINFLNTIAQHNVSEIANESLSLSGKLPPRLSKIKTLVNYGKSIIPTKAYIVEQQQRFLFHSLDQAAGFGNSIREFIDGNEFEINKQFTEQTFDKALGSDVSPLYALLFITMALVIKRSGENVALAWCDHIEKLLTKKYDEYHKEKLKHRI